MFLEQFYPDRLEESSYKIPYEKYYKKGYRGIIFDIDNTLVPHGAAADEKAIALFERLRKIGFSCRLLSNNHEPRVKPFADKVGVAYVFDAGKPKRAGYEEAMKEMGTKKENTLFIGDQLFTDVWGAKRCGIYSIRVLPIDPKEEIQIVLKRRLEAIVLFFYHRSLKKGNKLLP